MNWSHFQRDIFEAFEHSRDSLLIEAVAGSGKTSTLVELANIMQRAFPQQRGVFLAFNKSIAMELQARIDAMVVRKPVTMGVAEQLQRSAQMDTEPWVQRYKTITPNVQAMTLHSAGWAAWRRAGGLDWEPQVKNDKVSVIMRELLTYEENKRFGETTRKLVGYAKGIGLVPGLATKYHVGRLPEFKDLTGEQVEFRPLVGDTDSTWEELIDHYGLDEDACNIDLVRRVLGTSLETAKETCDFDDMLYMPVVAGVPFDRYDVVLVDEAQDVSGIQMEMIQRMVSSAGLPKRSNGRVIAVGDRNQAIYGFRGAGTTSMDQMKELFHMSELPLSVSYRCPQDVVTWAQQWVPQIEWADTADFGYVGQEGTDWAAQCEIALEGITKWRGLHDFRPGDAILCRLTRPLVAAAFLLIRNRVAGVHVLGRDIGKGLVDLIRKAKSLQDARVEEFDRWLDDYEQREGSRLKGKGKHAQAGLLVDKVDTIRVFMEQLGEEDTVPKLVAEIERLFVDANGGQARMITLATVHKAKGLEWERVFVLDAGEFMPCPWARGGGWEMQQEWNCCYIAATRAQRELRYIKTSDLRGGDVL